MGWMTESCIQQQCETVRSSKDSVNDVKHMANMYN